MTSLLFFPVPRQTACRVRPAPEAKIHKYIRILLEETPSSAPCRT